MNRPGFDGSATACSRLHFSEKYDKYLTKPK